MIVVPLLKKENDFWAYDGHSHSYLTLKELIDYKDSHLTTQWSGLLSPEQIKDLDNGIIPTIWCQGTNQVGYERRTWTEENTILDYLIEKLKDRADDLYIIPSWYWEKNDENGNWGYNNADKIRIVFWFDN